MAKELEKIIKEAAFIGKMDQVAALNENYLLESFCPAAIKGYHHKQKALAEKD